MYRRLGIWRLKDTHIITRWHHSCGSSHSKCDLPDPVMDALELLQQDHERVKKLLKRVELTGDRKQQKQIFNEIKAELQAHTRIEEKIFYPAMEQHEELRGMVLEALDRHQQVRTLLRQMARISSSSEKFKPKLKSLHDHIEHHSRDEEEEFFPKIREVINSAELKQLCQKLESAQQKLKRARARSLSQWLGERISRMG
jgi:hemerythrin superfamily protein